MDFEVPRGRRSRNTCRCRDEGLASGGAELGTQDRSTSSPSVRIARLSPIGMLRR